LERSTMAPVLRSLATSCPAGTANTLTPALAAAVSFSGTPPTGPTVASGSIIPVMEKSLLTLDPSKAARNPTAIAALALGPPTMGLSASILTK